MKPRKNELWIAHTPFVDIEGSKARPVIIISNNSYNKNHPDIISCGITTNNTHDCFVEIQKDELETGELFEKCGARADMIWRTSKLKLREKIGKAKPEFHEKLLKRINELMI